MPPRAKPQTANVAALLDAEAARARPPSPAPNEHGPVGHTMFDLPGSEDGSITVLLARDRLQHAPAQSLVRIESTPDGRRYLGVVSAGPFAEPDSLRGDAPVLVAVAARGGQYVPSFHGRLQVTLLGEELADGSLTPPRLRPLPHSPVYALSEEESARILQADGDLRLGVAVGTAGLAVGLSSESKAVLPRHTAILGTTGGGKSTTVAGLVARARAAGMAVILLDVEGEYTFLHEPTDDPRMRASLKERGLPIGGVPADRMTVHHLAGRDTTNPDHPHRKSFSLQFARLSPYAAMELLGLNDAQTDRFLFAYDVAKATLRDLGVFPQRDADPAAREKQERILLRLDEFERGYPRLELEFLNDVVAACLARVSKSTPRFYGKLMRTEGAAEIVSNHIGETARMPGSASSWGKLNSLLWRLRRLKVFDRHTNGAKFVDYRDLIRPGHLSVVDLSDTGMTELTNLVIADLLRGVQEAQETAYRDFERMKAGKPPRVLIVVEEAHEFLSAERIEQTPVLFQQVARIAKRGRKRWLGLAFVTQSPQHLPRQVLGLVNSFILHKLTDPQVLHGLQKTVHGVDDGLWARLPGLAPGQAVASFPGWTRPLLVAVDPTPAKLRLVE